jgi:hypothetical protein
MKPTKLTEDQIQTAVASAIKDARSFIESEIAPDRLKAQKYLDGGTSVAAEEGRSSVVATKVRDVVRAAKPALMRLFMQSGKPVEFVPRGPEDVAEAEQKTAYANWKFAELGGYKVLASAIDDALVKKTGIVKVAFEESEEVESEEYTGLTEEQFLSLAYDEEVEIAEYSQTEAMIDGMPVLLIDARIERRSNVGRLVLDAIPPENFFVDAAARGVPDALIVGHAENKRVSDLVAMGVPFDEACDLDAEGEDEEDAERRNYNDDSDGGIDPAMRPVLVTEAYMRIDLDGKGVAQTYRFLCGGTKYKILQREPCAEPPFAIFEPDPIPHKFFGRSLAELVINDQDAATVLLRGLLDNIIATNIPRTLINPEFVQTDDVLNNEHGGIIRTRDMGAYQELTVPFAAGQTLPAMEYYDRIVAGRSGVLDSSVALNPDALRSTTATGVDAIVGQAEGQTELMARNLAETGMTQLFRLMLKTMRRNAKVEEMMRVDGQFVPVDPRSWTATMDMTVNVGLGTGQQAARAMALREILGTQQAIWQAYGPDNGLVTLTNMRNTLADIAVFSRLPNVDRYYQPMSPQIEEQRAMSAQEAAANQPPQADPATLMAQAEQMKAQASMAQAEARMAEAQARVQLGAESKVLDDDLERDKMAQNIFFQAAEFEAKYGQRLNLMPLRAEMNA